MKRLRRKNVRERSVEEAIRILEEEVEPIFRVKKKFLITKHKIHEKHDNKYHRMFLGIIEYLEEIRGNHANPLKSLLRDYFKSIYESYSNYSFQPRLNNFWPSSNNMIIFQEWIERREKINDEPYWVSEVPELRIFVNNEESIKSVNLLEV